MFIRTACVALLALLVPAAALAQTSEVRTAIRHAETTASAQGQSAEYVATDAVASPGSATTFVYLRQSIGGIEVVGTEATVAVRSGAVAHVAGASRLADAAADKASIPALSASDAAASLARHNALGAPSFVVMSQKAGADRAVTMTTALSSDTVPARLVYVLNEEAEPVLTWEVALPPIGDHAWLGYVDATTGEVLRQMDLVVHDTFGDAPPASFAPVRHEAASSVAPAMVGSYNVFAMPIEAPYYGSRSVVANPDDATASPYGWHDTNGAAGAEYTVTRGNNVHAYTDIDNNNSPDAGSSPDGGASLVFDFPLDLNQSPSTYRPAAVTNLFYWNNIIHDVLYHHGFAEANGNFQVNNYGNGGAGNDDVRAEAQDGGGTCNANMFTPSDGSRPRMQMYTCGGRDGDFDNGVIVHEYGHGISNRLTGGPGASGCLGNSEQMGEGWSDWYGLMLTMETGDTGPDARGIGNYLFGYGPNGGGIRPAPYSTNFGVNDYTYQRTRSGLSVPHGIGFVWATILWEATWDMIDAHGFSTDFYNASGTAGNQIMLRLVTEGMKYQPCSPGFVDGRDAILAAEQALYGGTYAATLQAAFARRGLGYSASQGSTFSNGDNTEAFDLWPTGGNNPPNAAFSSNCTDLTCSFSDASTDSDGTIVSRSWTFGDGASSSATNPSHTYGAAGTYTVTLTVTDDDGDSDSASQSVTVSEPGGFPIALTVETSTHPRKGNQATLRWTPADGGRVFVYRNGVQIARTRDKGNYRDNPSGNGPFTYQVCETDSGDCSNEETVSFLAPSLAGDAGVFADEPVTIAPNPFAGQTTLRFALAEEADVTLEVFNAVGQRVAVLASGLHTAGRHEASFDASALPAGVYVWRLTTGSDVQTGRMALTR